MDAWTPVRPLQVEVVGIHPRYSRLLVARMALDRPLPDRWAALFDEVAGEEPSPTGEPAPQLRDQAVHFTPPDQELEAAVAHVERLIRRANAAYEDAVVRHETDPGEAARQRLEAARKRADAITGDYKTRRSTRTGS